MKNQKLYMEHANLTVRDLDKTLLFFQSAFPDFKVRGGGGKGLDKWMHIGNDDTYLAVRQGPIDGKPLGHDMYQNGFNHIGFVVEDIEQTVNGLLAAGFKRNYPRTEQEFRIREYFLDHDGNEFEFIQYSSNNYDERNTYND